MSNSLQMPTHQTDTKEHAPTKAHYFVASRLLCLDQNAALEHTTKTIGDCQQACVVCTCMTGITALEVIFA